MGQRNGISPSPCNCRALPVTRRFTRREDVDSLLLPCSVEAHGRTQGTTRDAERCTALRDARQAEPCAALASRVMRCPGTARLRQGLTVFGARCGSWLRTEDP